VPSMQTSSICVIYACVKREDRNGTGEQAGERALCAGGFFARGCGRTWMVHATWVTSATATAITLWRYGLVAGLAWRCRAFIPLYLRVGRSGDAANARHVPGLAVARCARYRSATPLPFALPFRRRAASWRMFFSLTCYNAGLRISARRA